MSAAFLIMNIPWKMETRFVILTFGIKKKKNRQSVGYIYGIFIVNIFTLPLKTGDTR